VACNAAIISPLALHFALPSLLAGIGRTCMVHTALNLARNVVSPCGKKEGVKTRNKKKASQRLLVRGRKRGKATQ
jgi:hypothetical protein